MDMAPFLTCVLPIWKHLPYLIQATFNACTDLLTCWLNGMNEGLRGGDIGALLNPTSPVEFGKYMLKLVYEFSFYVVVITVLLNVIFGIIIDTFAQLREANALKR